MNRRLVVTGLLIGWVLLAAAALTPASEDVLRLVPNAASGFIVINRTSALDAKLQALGREVQLPVPSPLGLLKAHTEICEGWDESGTIGMVVLPPEEGASLPIAILLVPVTDYGKFIGQLKPDNAAAPVSKIEFAQTPGFVRNVGGYAAISDASHREALQSLSLSPQIAATLAPWQQWLAESDVAGVILQPGIKRLVTLAHQGMEMAKATLAQAPEHAKAMARAFDAYDTLFQACAKELTGVGIGVQLDQQNTLRVVSRGLLTPGGKWAQLVAQGGSAKEDLLMGLPQGPFLAAGGASISDSLWAAMMSVSIDMMKNMHEMYGLSDAQIEKMSNSSMMKMKGVRGMSMVMGVGRGSESLYAGLTGIMRVDNTQTFLSDYEKAIRQYSEVLQGGHSPMLPPMEVEKTNVGGTPALQLTMQAPQLPEGQKTPNYDQMMEAMFGPGGKLVAWLVPADEHHAVIGYVNKEPLLQTVAAIKQGAPGLAADADVKKTAALLPSGASLVVYLSPQGAIDFVKRIVPALVPPEAKPDLKLPDFPKTPPIGVAVTTSPGEVRKQLVIPAEVIKAIAQYAGQVAAAHSGAGGAP